MIRQAASFALYLKYKKYIAWTALCLNIAVRRRGRKTKAATSEKLKSQNVKPPGGFECYPI